MPAAETTQHVGPCKTPRASKHVCGSATPCISDRASTGPQAEQRGVTALAGWRRPRRLPHQRESKRYGALDVGVYVCDTKRKPARDKPAPPAPPTPHTPPPLFPCAALLPARPDYADGAPHRQAAALAARVGAGPCAGGALLARLPACPPTHRPAFRRRQQDACSVCTANLSAKNAGCAETQEVSTTHNLIL